MRDVDSHPAASVARGVVVCAQCGKAASGDRAFCGDCGARLWDPCIECGARNSVAERFCCQCGADLQRAISAIQVELDRRLALAEKEERAGNLLAAHQALENSPEPDHSQLASRVALVRARSAELHEARLRAISERSQRIARARQFIEERRYADAFGLLDGIPASLRDQEARRLLSDVEKPLAEIKRLREALVVALKTGKTDGSLGMAERLVELVPYSEETKRLCEQLRVQQQQRDLVLGKRLLAKARTAITANDYRTARQCIERLPALSSEEERKLRDAIEERVWLEKQLRSAVYADKTLLRLSERFCKLQPKDEAARKVHTTLTGRLARAENSDGRPFVPWAQTNEKTRFGPRIEPVSNLPHVHWQADRKEVSAWIEHMRRFLVALGLGLSALGESAFGDLDFQSGQSSWFERLKGGRRRKRPAAWGLDIGASGLKALRLVRNSEAVTVDRAYLAPYPLDNSRGETWQYQAAIAPAYAKFVQECTPGDEPVVASFPGAQSLGRFFTLPAMKSSKLEKAIEIEVKNQIPLPPDEVVWQSQVWQPIANSETSGNQVVVAAARRAHVDMRAAALSDLGPSTWTLESECIALLNTLMHCYGSQVEQQAAEEAIALVEIGDSATHFVALSPKNGPWFRTIHRGMRLLSRPLVEAFDITWLQADMLRQQWPGPRPMVAVDRLLAPGIEELSRELERALRAFVEATGGIVTRIYVCGGGGDQFGLLREWTSGIPSVAVAES